MYCTTFSYIAFLPIRLVMLKIKFHTDGGHHIHMIKITLTTWSVKESKFFTIINLISSGSAITRVGIAPM